MVGVEQVGLADVDCVTCNSRGLRRHLPARVNCPTRSYCSSRAQSATLHTRKMLRPLHRHVVSNGSRATG